MSYTWSFWETAVANIFFSLKDRPLHNVFSSLVHNTREQNV